MRSSFLTSLSDSRTVPLGIVALAFGPTFGALGGGADLTVGPCKVEWFDASTGALVLVGAILLTLIRPLDDWKSRVGRGVSTLGFLVSIAVLWGACKPQLVSISDADVPIGLAWGGLVLAASRRPSDLLVTNPGRASIRLAISLAAGWLLTVACVQFHERELERHMGFGDSETARGDVLFIVVDTLRADALGAYGGQTTHTPFLDRLARESAVFETTLSQAAWTVPSVASMMSGFYPSTLRGPRRDRDSHSKVYRFPAGVPRLVHRFAAAGYRTAGYVKNPYLVESSGFAAGFEVYRRVAGNAAKRESGKHLVRAVLHWAKVLSKRRARGRDAPFFLYLHFMDPHISYLPPKRFMPNVSGYHGPFDGRSETIVHHLETDRQATAADKAFLWSLYSAEVYYLDSVLSNLYVELARLGLWTKETTIVFTSDHGEQFGEHDGFLHRDKKNGGLHVESLRVPLMIRHPGLEPRRHADPVRIIDIAPTVLDLMELPALPETDGRSLLPLLKGGELIGVPVISQHHQGYRVMTDGYAMIVDGDSTLLYDRRTDPTERTNVVTKHPEVVANLRIILDQYRQRPDRLADKRAPTTNIEPIDPETRRALEAIGYVE